MNVLYIAYSTTKITVYYLNIVTRYNYKELGEDKTIYKKQNNKNPWKSKVIPKNSGQ